MTALLELRENLKKIYSRNEAFILPVIKFLLSFIVLSIINGKMGYMTKPVSYTHLVRHWM